MVCAQHSSIIEIFILSSTLTNESKSECRVSDSDTLTELPGDNNSFIRGSDLTGLRKIWHLNF